MADTDPLLGHGRQIIVREDWLRLIAEPVLEPGLPIVDPHHHLWQRDEGSYLLPDLLADTASGHDIRGTIFVQCGEMYRAGGPVEEQPLGETEFVTGIAAVSASGRHGPTRACAGIIGMVDLTLGERVEPLLEAHQAIAGARFCGIRNRTAWHPSPEVTSNLVSPPPGPLQHPAFADGARRLARLGLPLDVWCYHTQLTHVIALARAVPELAIVVDHVGGPLGIGPFAGRQAEVFPEWKRQMLALAALPNVVVKLGGLTMYVSGYDFHRRPRPPGSEELAATWRPHVETCIEAFGADRCMFESNFPVDKGMCSYPVLWNAFKRLASGASAAEKTALFSGTAMRTYRLDRLPEALSIDLSAR
ncbi:MAG: amidohydrolase family protein [Reyranellaceae bacterium]